MKMKKKKKLQTQVLHRIRDEEHHQSKKNKIYKNSQKFSNTLFWDTKTVWEKDLEKEREREKENKKMVWLNNQTSKQASKGFVEFAHKFAKKKGKGGRKKKGMSDSGFFGGTSF